MVDSISNSNTPSLSELQAQAKEIMQSEKTDLLAILNKGNSKTDEEKDGLLNVLLDQAEISPAAQAKLEAEKQIQAYANAAQSTDEDYDADKVAYFKDLLDSGRISDYLRNFSNDDFANMLLDSPIKSALQ